MYSLLISVRMIQWNWSLDLIVGLLELLCNISLAYVDSYHSVSLPEPRLRWQLVRYDLTLL